MLFVIDIVIANASFAIVVGGGGCVIASVCFVIDIAIDIDSASCAIAGGGGGGVIASVVLLLLFPKPRLRMGFL